MKNDRIIDKVSSRDGMKFVEENNFEDIMIKNISNIVDKYPGNQNLCFLVYDDDEKIKLEMPSEKQKVDISNDFLNDLKKSKIYFKLN